MIRFKVAMDVLQNYKKYKEYIPQYNNWSMQQSEQQARREAYLVQNPDKVNQEDIRRGQILLHAIDVMDEYSQANAEDMEVATEIASTQIVAAAQTAGTMLGTGALLLPKVRDWCNSLAYKNSKYMAVFMMLPSMIGMIVGTIASFPAVIWSTKMQVGASRAGRFEAMRNDLKNPANFALLTEEQLVKASELAKDIELDDKDKKRLEKLKSMNLNVFEPFKTLKKMMTGSKEYQAQRESFDRVLNANEKMFSNKLSPEQIEKAKRDQQLLSKLVNKIDIASQDYAENVELATNSIVTLGLAGGGAIGWISNKLLKFFKVGQSGMFAKAFPWTVGISIATLAAVFSAKLQKQASRIGRFKARQEFLNNPNSLVYVADENTSELKNIQVPEKSKKPGFFKFLSQVLKDEKEYKNYRKNEGEKNLKFQKALEKIDLTQEQLQEAKILQMNTFKTFNKVDEKSQEYSESVEAVGEIAKQGINFFAGIGVTLVVVGEMFGLMKKGRLKFNSNFIGKYLKSIILPVAIPTLAIIGLDAYVTKEQKKASRVANMLALKDLEDYRHYADFSSKSLNNQPIQNQSSKEEMKNQNSNLLSRLK